MEGTIILVLIIIVVIYWLTPLFFLILGLIKLKSKPEKAKTYFIIAAIMLVVGAGFCGILLS